MSALIWCTFADRDSAKEVANRLLDERLIVCANLSGPIESIFEWEGERGNAEEIGVLFKTDAALLDQAIAGLERFHPYDTPAILGWKCDSAADATRAWLGLLKQRKE